MQINSHQSVGAMMTQYEQFNAFVNHSLTAYHRLDLSAVLSALTDLIVNDELGILVEDRILSSRERSKVLQDVLWMDVGRSGLRDVVRLLH